MKRWLIWLLSGPDTQMRISLEYLALCLEGLRRRGGG